MDLIDITTLSVLALIVGLVTGWLIARSRFTTTVADLNSKLVLERRVNKQLSEAVQVAAVSNFMPRPDLSGVDLTSATEPARQSMVLSG